MRRYAVVIVLAAWGVALALGCDWTPVLWVVLLVPALMVQMTAQAKSYRHHHRRHS